MVSYSCTPMGQPLAASGSLWELLGASVSLWDALGRVGVLVICCNSSQEFVEPKTMVSDKPMCKHLAASGNLWQPLGASGWEPLGEGGGGRIFVELTAKSWLSTHGFRQP